MSLQEYFNAPVYYVRLDDAHPKMHHEQWSKFESILDQFDIKPMIAVIPANGDHSIEYSSEDLLFWEKVKKWQIKGWHIALHGYNHIFSTNNPGIIPFNAYSEFAGLPLEEQRDKFRNAINIFKKNGVTPTLFIAPAHSFDLNTLKALKAETDIRVISDGVSLFPYDRYGFRFIPQQLWKFRKLPLGTWTCCFHPSSSNSIAIGKLENFIRANQTHFVHGLGNMEGQRSKSILDLLFTFVYFFSFRLRKALRSLKK